MGNLKIRAYPDFLCTKISEASQKAKKQRVLFLFDPSKTSILLNCIKKFD